MAIIKAIYTHLSNLTYLTAEPQPILSKVVQGESNDKQQC